jgi:hypothetical protein
MMLADRLIESKWSAIAPLLAALVLLPTLAIIHGAFATKVRPPLGTSEFTLTAERYAGRLDFTAALEVQVISIVVAVAVGIGLAMSAIRKSARSDRRVIAAIIAIGVVAALIIILDEQSPPEYGALLKETVAQHLTEVNTLRLTFELMTALTATILGIATALVLLPAEGDAIIPRLEAAAESYRRVSYLLTVGTIVLAADIYTKTVLTKWAVTYFTSEVDKAAVAALGKSIVTGWGVYDSLFLAATYIPSALLLRTRLRVWGTAVDLKTAPAWFNAKWLSDTSLEDVGRAAATLTPFIVGQAANLIKG